MDDPTCTRFERMQDNGTFVAFYQSVCISRHEELKSSCCVSCHKRCCLIHSFEPETLLILSNQGVTIVVNVITFSRHSISIVAVSIKFKTEGFMDEK